MKIKSKPAVKTVTAKKTRTTVKKAAPKAAAKPVEKSVTFTVRAESGKAVYLAGTFNNWDPAGKKMLEKKGDGVYSVAIKLVPGTYQYKFVIDGTWCADPGSTAPGAPIRRTGISCRTTTARSTA